MALHPGFWGTENKVKPAPMVWAQENARNAIDDTRTSEPRHSPYAGLLSNYHAAADDGAGNSIGTSRSAIGDRPVSRYTMPELL